MNVKGNGTGTLVEWRKHPLLFMNVDKKYKAMKPVSDLPQMVPLCIVSLNASTHWLDDRKVIWPLKTEPSSSPLEQMKEDNQWSS